MITRLIIKKANIYLNKYGRTKKFEAFENFISSTHYAKLIYLFARGVKDTDIEKFAKAIADTYNAEYIYLFAFFLPIKDITALQEAIIKTKNAEYIYKFACFIKGADINRLHHALMKTGNVKYIHKLGHYFNTINILDIEHAVNKYATKKELDTFYNDKVIIKKIKESLVCVEVEENHAIIKDMLDMNLKTVRKTLSEEEVRVNEINNNFPDLSSEDKQLLIELEQAFANMSKVRLQSILK